MVCLITSLRLTLPETVVQSVTGPIATVDAPPMTVMMLAVTNSDLQELYPRAILSPLR